MTERDARPEVERIILRLERETMAAIERKDAEALGRILADDFVYRTPAGDEQDRGAFLKQVTSLPLKIVSVRGENLRVSVYGETAVLTGVQRATVLTAEGREAVGVGAFTDVFVRRGGRWLMVLAFSVDLPEVPAAESPK